MKIVAISDTHGQHKQLDIPDGDVLIHAGDCTKHGTPEDLFSFLYWFKKWPHKHKIFIAGNHDRCLLYTEEDHLEGIRYLENSSMIIDGVKFWGSPYTPKFGDWAFMLPRDEMKNVWDKIPVDADVVITHGPAYGLADLTVDGVNAGCSSLRETLEDIKPLLHICGHIHEGHGAESPPWLNTNVHNVSVLDENYRLVNPPTIIDI